MIALLNVCKTYGEHHVLHNINLEVTQGELLVIIGGSGSGKSTVLRTMIGLLQPTSGEIWVNGSEISRMAEDELNDVRLHMGMVFQYSALFDSMTVGENVAFSLRQHTNRSDSDIRATVDNCLELVGLKGYESYMPAELSGGMKKRVSLARAVANKPAIVLYDEPTSGLDPITAGVIDRLIKDTQQRLGVTSVVVTHDMSSAFAIADRIVMIHEGQIIEVGTVEQIQMSRNPLVQQFIHGGH